MTRGKVGAVGLGVGALLVLTAVVGPRVARLAPLAAGGSAPVALPLSAPSVPGRIAYAVAGNIWIWQGGAHQRTSSGHDGAPALSADGGRLAYVRYDDSFSDIVVAGTDGGEPQFLTHNRPQAETGSHDYVQQAVWALMPAWAPAGDRLAYVSDPGTDAPVLWIMGAGGENPHSLQTSPANPPLERPHWAPDGTAIAGTSMGSGKDEIWSLDLASGTWTEVAAPAAGAYDPDWSPDGSFVAYAARTAGQTDIWIGPADRSHPPVQATHLGRARAPVFSPDGKFLAFLAEKDERFQIFVAGVTANGTTMQVGTSEQLTAGAGLDAASGLSWSK